MMLVRGLLLMSRKMEPDDWKNPESRASNREGQNV